MQILTAAVGGDRDREAAVGGGHRAGLDPAEGDEDALAGEPGAREPVDQLPGHDVAAVVVAVDRPGPEIRVRVDLDLGRGRDWSGHGERRDHEQPRDPGCHARW